MSAARPTPLLDLLNQLGTNPGLLERLSLEQVVHFVTLTTRLREDIALNQRSTATFDAVNAPMFLDDATACVISGTLQLDILDIQALWECLRSIIWEGALSVEAIKEDDQLKLLDWTTSVRRSNEGRGTFLFLRCAPTQSDPLGFLISRD